MNKVTVVARIRAKLGKEDALKPLLIGMLSPTRAEQGCINYDLHQSADDKTLFLYYENWESLDDLKAHSGSAHIKAFREKAADLFAEPIEITLWQMIE